MHSSVDLFIYIYVCIILTLMSTPWINKVILPLPYLTLTLHDLYKKSVDGLNKEQSAEVASLLITLLMTSFLKDLMTLDERKERSTR